MSVMQAIEALESFWLRSMRNVKRTLFCISVKVDPAGKGIIQFRGVPCIVWATHKLAYLSSGTKFVIETDHCPLSWLQQMSLKNGCLLKWSLLLQDLSFEVKYKGKKNGNADGLSRACRAIDSSLLFRPFHSLSLLS